MPTKFKHMLNNHCITITQQINIYIISQRLAIYFVPVKKALPSNARGRALPCLKLNFFYICRESNKYPEHSIAKPWVKLNNHSIFFSLYAFSSIIQTVNFFIYSIQDTL